MPEEPYISRPGLAGFFDRIADQFTGGAARERDEMTYALQQDFEKREARRREEESRQKQFERLLKQDIAAEEHREFTRQQSELARGRAEKELRWQEQDREDKETAMGAVNEYLTGPGFDKVLAAHEERMDKGLTLSQQAIERRDFSDKITSGFIQAGSKHSPRVQMFMQDLFTKHPTISGLGSFGEEERVLRSLEEPPVASQPTVISPGQALGKMKKGALTGEIEPGAENTWHTGPIDAKDWANLARRSMESRKSGGAAGLEDAYSNKWARSPNESVLGERMNLLGPNEKRLLAQKGWKGPYVATGLLRTKLPEKEQRVAAKWAFSDFMGGNSERGLAVADAWPALDSEAQKFAFDVREGVRVLLDYTPQRLRQYRDALALELARKTETGAIFPSLESFQIGKGHLAEAHAEVEEFLGELIYRHVSSVSDDLLSDSIKKDLMHPYRDEVESWLKAHFAQLGYGSTE